MGGEANGIGVLEFGDHAVRRHFAMGVAGARNFELGAHHQRVCELPLDAHALGGNRTAVSRHKIHQAKADRLHTRVGGDVKGAVHGCGRLGQHMHRQMAGSRSDQGRLHAVHIGYALDFGHHDVRQNATGPARDVAHVGFKTGVVHRVDPHRNARIGASGFCGQCQFGHQRCMLGFATDWRAVFAIQGDIKNASAELLHHFCLQLQAFAHPRLHSAVVVTHRQLHAGGLCSQQNVARMAHLDFSA